MPEELKRRLLALPRGRKMVLVFISDAVLCAWSAWAAIYLRIGDWVWLEGNQWLAVLAAVAIALPIFHFTGLYKSILRHAGWPSMLVLIRACLVFGAIYSLIFTFVGIADVPRTIGLIQPVLLFVSLAAFRALAHHVLSGESRRDPHPGGRVRVLIYGAGEAGRQIAGALRRSGDMEIVGFLDDDRSLHRGLLEGVRIYQPTEAPELIRQLEVTEVLLAMPSAPRRRRRRLVEMLHNTGVNIRTLPGLLDIARGEIHVSEIRPLQIEDLLGRDSVLPNPDLLTKNVGGKVVMVTGGGGSIGSELCRQIAGIGPAKILIVDASEYNLYAIERDLRHRQRLGFGKEVELVPLLASVQDEARMAAIMARFQPHTIYHAAAYKHVPIVEHNCLEGLKNNVFGTFATARMAREHGVTDFVLISTDKAVRPTNVMGASKRLAEMVVQALAAEQSHTRYSIVRFGNVLGSSGSVVPLFREQINAGGPITITHSEVTRYFMTIPEAAQLVLQAGAMADRGEVFVLDMGEPVLVRDLAVNMIRLSGLTLKDESNPDGDIEIEVIGLRPGEKLHEELLIGESPMPTLHDRIMRAHEDFLSMETLEPQLRAMKSAITSSDVDAALRLLRSLVPEYCDQGSPGDLAAEDGGAAMDRQGSLRVAL